MLVLWYTMDILVVHVAVCITADLKKLLTKDTLSKKKIVRVLFLKDIL